MKKQSTLHDMSKATKGRVDWVKVDATTEAEIEAQALEGGEELIEWTPEMLARAKQAPKQLVSVRLDPDVLDRRHADRPGYQSRIKAILRAYYSTVGR